MSRQQPASSLGLSHYDSSQDYDTSLELGANIHYLIQSALNSSDQFSTGQTGFSSTPVGVIPTTPQRSQQNNTVAPLTPLANLKVLAEASSAVEGREVGDEGRCEDGKGVKREIGAGVMGESVMGESVKGEEGGRKMKSLAVLCKRFLCIVEKSVGIGNEFSLDSMAQKLGTNRRRIYDIINVLEAVEMIVKQSKNLYLWRGRGLLLDTLAKLKAMAADDPELNNWFVQTKSDKENEAPPIATVARQQSQSSSVVDESSQDSISDEVSCCEDGHSKGGRWDKSLGVLCQKFIMLFLTAPNHEMTLDQAGSVLMPEHVPSVNATSKTKVRRLYDIANVLTTLELIKKKTFMAANHRKMPGYVWCGPSLEEIDSVGVCRKKEYQSEIVSVDSKSSSSRRFRGLSLTRHNSLGNKPFLHHYEVKDSNSAPNTPCKTAAPLAPRPLRGRLLGTFSKAQGGSSIRRSLSFGGQSSIGGRGHGRRVGVAKSEDVVCGGVWLPTAKPGCSREELTREMREFEQTVMTNYSHCFPNAAPIFQDFIRQYQTSLEWNTTTGRPLFPKPPTTTISNFSDYSLSFSKSCISKSSTPLPQPLVREEAAASLSGQEREGDERDTDVLLEKETRPSLLNQDNDSGLGDSLVGGALATSLDDVVGISQQSSAVDVATKEPQAESEEVARSTSEEKKSRSHTTRCGIAMATSAITRSDSSQTKTDAISGECSYSWPDLLPLTSVTLPSSTADGSCHSSSLPLPPLPKWVSGTCLAPQHSRPPPDSCAATSSAGEESETGCNDASTSSSSEVAGKDANITPREVSRSHSPTSDVSALTGSAKVPPGGRESEVKGRPPLTQQFTKWTLQSPKKPAHGGSQSFVRVDDFLAALAAQTREAESLLQDPGLVSRLHVAPHAAAQTTTTLLSHLLTRQPLPGTTARKQTSVHAPSFGSLDPRSLVNQNPIPATVELNKMGVASLHGNNVSKTSHVGFLTTPGLVPSAQYLGPLVSGATPGFAAPLPPYQALPPFSTLCHRALGDGGATPTPLSCQATSEVEPRLAVVGECPPLKRAKLV